MKTRYHQIMESIVPIIIHMSNWINLARYVMHMSSATKHSIGFCWHSTTGALRLLQPLNNIVLVPINFVTQ